MSWTDDEIDDLYREGAEKLQFEYKEAYWKEMEALLPKKRGGDGLWYLLSFSFMAIFGVMMIQNFFQASFTSTGKGQLATIESQNRIQEPSQKSGTGVQETEIAENYQSGQAIGTSQKTNVKTTDRIIESKLTSPLHQTPIMVSNVNNQEQIVRVGIDENPILPSQNKELNEKGSLDNTFEEVGSLATRKVDLSTNNLSEIRTFIPGNCVNSWLFQAYAQLNSSVSQSLITPSKAISFVYGAGAGLSMQKGRFLLNFGVGYGVEQYSDLLLTRTAKVYGFGSTIYNYDIKIDHMYKLDGHIEAGWQMKRSIIRANFRPAYLLNTRVSYTQTSGIDDSQQEQEKRTAYGYTDGLSRFGMRVGMGYAYRLTPGIELGLNAGFQTIKMVDESFITGKNNAFALDGQVYIRKLISIK